MTALLTGCGPSLPNSRTIEVTDQRICLDGVTLNESALRDALRDDRISRKGGDCQVIVLVSPDCHYPQIERLCDVFASAGIWKTQFALTDSTNQQVRIWPFLTESVHVPWHVVTAYISGNQTFIATNLSEVTASRKGSINNFCVLFNADPNTTAKELFVFLQPWANIDADISRDHRIGSNNPAHATGKPAPDR
ncbi:MAG: hypothetical protein WCL49_06570 [bacterium]